MIRREIQAEENPNSTNEHAANPNAQPQLMDETQENLQQDDEEAKVQANIAADRMEALVSQIMRLLLRRVC